MTTQVQNPKRVLTRRVAPAILLLFTIGSTTIAGVLFMGDRDSFLRSLGGASLFAMAVLLSMGAHAFGHYLAARRNGVDVSFPYFIPALTMAGMAGAYVKLSWPIEDRRVLLRIFTAGPIAGFLVSAAVLLGGVALSQTTANIPEGSFILGDSLLILGFQKIVFPGMKPGEEVLLHPLGLAGVIGLYFNLWHLFPAGRLDGGRVVYALFGYRTALIVSWVTIALLALLAVVWPGWLATAVFAALTMIRLKRQHPAAERHEQPRDPATLRLVGAMLVILVLTFVPVPTKVPQQSAPPVGEVASTAVW